MLKDDEYLSLECINCNITKKEKILNISNYSSEWMSNEIYKSCNLNHEEKKLSIVYCQNCKLNLCQRCYEIHNKKHKFKFLQEFNIIFCHSHNIKNSYYCKNCDFEFCEKCISSHEKHNYIRLDNNDIDKINGGLMNLFMFEKFLLNTKKIQKEKLIFIDIIVNSLVNLNHENKEMIDKTISKILNLFYKDFKSEQNLIFLSKVIFATYKLSQKFQNDLDKINNYKTILNVIYNSFKSEKFEKFKSSIITLKTKFELASSQLSIEENNELKNNIADTFKTYDINNPDFDIEKNYIKKTMECSSILKKYISIEKERNPDNYIDIDKTLNDNEHIYDNLNTLEDEGFLLSLFGKCFEKDGIEVNISKKKNEKFKDIELASVQSLFSLGNKNKYELHFDFGENINKKILKEPEEKEKFLEEWKNKLSQTLNIDKEKLILANVQRGSVSVEVVILDSTTEQEKKAVIRLKEISEIKKIKKKPFIDVLQISPEILDKKGNRFKGWGINETRGGEKYIPPVDGWYGIGLKVKNKYDNGNNAWLDYRNKPGEYAVAYIGFNDIDNNSDKLIKNINSLSNIDEINNKSYINDSNMRKKSSDYLYGGLGMAISIPFYLFSSVAKNAFSKSTNLLYQEATCGDGICVFQNPEYAENSAKNIDISGYRIKIMLMCRVNPNKIRQPKSFPECWILNHKDIRPYRILIKIIPISPLTDTKNIHMKFFQSPIPYVIDAIKSNDFSFYELAKEERFKNIASINKQKVKDDDFVIRLYSSIYFKFINPYLRNKEILEKYKEWSGFTEKQLKSWICCLQLALSRNKNVKEDTIVYRGVNCKFPSHIGIGSKFYFPEFVSTSIKKDFCEKWIKHEGTIMIIKIKNNGTNGHPNYCYYIEDITYTKNQYEVLISCHCYYTVTKIVHDNKIDYISLVCEGYLIK